MLENASKVPEWANTPPFHGSYAYLPEDRLRFLPETRKRSRRSDFDRDRARILHAAGLRRLGTKTQVLGPVTDDFVRTRLTHSLEVAQIGRGLALELGADPDVVDAACLAHDLGHPPFGHNGEVALDEAARDIGGFEGNAQSFRLVARLEAKVVSEEGLPGGLNLTRATLDALTKYPWRKGSGPKGEASRKFGYYEDDSEVFDWMRRGAPTFGRPLEAQIMDLADDVAYSVHDFEDAVVTGRMDVACLGSPKKIDEVISSTLSWYGSKVSGDQLERAASRLLALPYWPADYTDSYASRAQVKNLTSQLIGRFCEAAELATKDRYGEGPLGRYEADLVVPSDVEAEIGFLKGVAVHFVMSPREIEPDYYQQRTLVADLVEALFEGGQDLLEGPFSEEWERAEDDAGRLRAVIDQVASLTDTSASQWHARHRGMLSTLL